MKVFGTLFIMGGAFITFMGFNFTTILDQILNTLLGGFTGVSGIILCVGGTIVSEMKRLATPKPSPVKESTPQTTEETAIES